MSTKYISNVIPAKSNNNFGNTFENCESVPTNVSYVVISYELGL